MTVIAEVDSDEQRVQFVALEAPASDDSTLEVAMAIQTRDGARDVVSALVEDGATPLEVYLRLADDGAPLPEVLVRHHPQAAELGGRELDVREYSDLPLVPEHWVSRQPGICAGPSSPSDTPRSRTRPPAGAERRPRCDLAATSRRAVSSARGMGDGKMILDVETLELTPVDIPPAGAGNQTPLTLDRDTLVQVYEDGRTTNERGATVYRVNPDGSVERLLAAGTGGDSAMVSRLR